MGESYRGLELHFEVRQTVEGSNENDVFSKKSRAIRRSDELESIVLKDAIE